MSRRGRLSDEDLKLWTGLARSITPLRRPRQTGTPSDSASRRLPAALPVAAEARPLHAKAKPAVRQESLPLVPLGRRLKQRVARGRDAIDARIDLHGMTQSQAHATLLRFLHAAREGGARTVLIVTGKGSGGTAHPHRGDSERGVLRRQVPLWLSLPEFRQLIVGFDHAHIGHGGLGALYVRLRRSS